MTLPLQPALSTPPIPAPDEPRGVGDGRPEQPSGPLALGADLWRATRDLFRGRALVARGPIVEGPFTCVLCGSSAGREPFRDRIPESRGFHLARCEGCGLVATHPRPAPADIPSFYGDEYYGAENAKFGPLTEVAILLFRLARVRALRLAGVRRGRVLDVGCGRGLFLHVLQRAGYEAWGTELSADSARAGQRLMKDRVRVGPVEQCGFDAGQFDAVTAWQVFEHLHDPHATLAELRRVLAPGGVLILSLPNVESFQARWAGATWFHYDVPRHLFHYGPDTLRRLLDQHGFDIEKTSHFSVEQNPFGLMQSALHRLGARYFGLYQLVRGPIDRERRDRLRRLPGYAAYLAAFPFAVALTWVGAALRTGATFSVIARRRDD